MALSCPVAAQDSEIARIRDEIRQMRETYERRIEALERRLTEAEARTASAPTTATPASPPLPQAATAPTVAPAGRGDNAYNPALSLILQGTYAHTSRDPESYAITGFIPSNGEVGPPKRSFGLAETELVFSGSIDPYFRGMAVAALSPEDEVEVEEAFVQTTSLPSGFTIKGGRFLSGIGYQNELHQHAWDFQDAPLPYKAFLGGRLRQDGVQLKWIAPTPVFLEFGAEASSGEGFPGSERSQNGVGGAALFAHLGGDVGAGTSWRAGLSFVRASPRGRSYEDVDSLGSPVVNAFSGRAKVWVADAVLKWAPDGNATRTSFKLQGEYLRFRQNGELSYDDSGGSGLFGTLAGSFASRQSGWYLQGVWQFIPRWRVGYRYDRLHFGNIDNGLIANGAGLTRADFPLLTPHDPRRSTVMLDWSPTEFSRVRLQFARDRSRIGEADDQVLLQYIHSLGAHGAHRF
jgi:hypothetical protein